MIQTKLSAAFEKIAANSQWRTELIRQLLIFEKHIATPDVDVRELITGPLVDALFDESQIVRKALSDGTQLDFYYRSKIARDLVMSFPEVPTHAWEPQTTRLLLNLARQSKQVVIGGAYFGDHAILIAKEVSKNSGSVHAFEPNNDQRSMMMHNASLNGLANIVPRAEGLWDDGLTTLTLVGADSFAHPEAVEKGTADGFQTTTVDDYLAAACISRLDMMMLDIEGGELRVLQGAKRFLAQPAGEAPKIVFEVHRNYVDWTGGLVNTEIVKLLLGFDYKVFAIRDFNSNYDLSNKPIELIPADSVYLEGPPHGFNMVAVKDDRMFDAAEYLVCTGVSPKLLRHKNPALHHPIGGL